MLEREGNIALFLLHTHKHTHSSRSSRLTRHTNKQVLTTMENIEHVTTESVLKFLIDDSKLFEDVMNVNLTVTDLMMMMRDSVLRSVTGDTFRDSVISNNLDTVVIFRRHRNDDLLRVAYLEAAETLMKVDFVELDSTTEIIDPFLVPIDEQRGVVMFTKSEERFRFVGSPTKEKIIEFVRSKLENEQVEQVQEEQHDGGLQQEQQPSCTSTTKESSNNDAEDETNALLRWFRDNKLSKWIRGFVELGVESIDDLRYITRNDMVGMGMAVVHQRKFFAAYSKLNLPAIEVLE
jgi:hypothetical protein